jgi:eukaryotic-like serine/threonine-protein kinase
MVLTPQSGGGARQLRGGAGQLWIRRIDSLEFRAVPGTEPARLPFWSPDSAYIGFTSGGKVKKIAVTGGPAQTLCDASEGQGFAGGTWSSDGTILFSAGAAIYSVNEGGGTRNPITKPAPETCTFFLSCCPMAGTFFTR